MKKNNQGLPRVYSTVAVATATLHYYVCVIMLPIIASESYSSITTFELGVMMTGHTSGVLISYKVFEPLIRLFGVNSVLNIGFTILVLANFGLWLCVIYVENSSDFAFIVFVSRFVGGVGSGLIDTSCLISRNYESDSSGIQAKEQSTSTYFMEHKKSEALGNLLGPLLVICAYPIKGDYAVFLLLAICSLCAGVACSTGLYCVPRRPTVIRAETQSRTYLNFVKSLLYNQVPLRAFMNRRSILAIMSLLASWTCATFFLPFFAIYVRQLEVI